MKKAFCTAKYAVAGEFRAVFYFARFSKAAKSSLECPPAATLFGNRKAFRVTDRAHLWNRFVIDVTRIRIIRVFYRLI